MLKHAFKILVLLGILLFLAISVKIYQRYQQQKDLEHPPSEESLSAPNAREKAKAMGMEPDETSTPLVRDELSPKDSNEKSASIEKHVSLCSPIYQKYFEGKPFRDAALSFLEDLLLLNQDKAEHAPCWNQLEYLHDQDHLLELATTCGKEYLLAKLPGEHKVPACFILGTLLWSSFFENEYLGQDPAEIPADALHPMIAFRVIEHELFLAAADDPARAYYFKLLDHMYQLRPDVSYGSTRAELIADLYQKNPKAWKEDYLRVLEEVEEEDPIEAILAFYHGSKSRMDKVFLEFVEGIDTRHPNSPWVHFYKACAQSGLGNWEAAEQELRWEEKLEPGKKTKIIASARESFQKKSAYIYIWSSHNIVLEIGPG